LISKTSLFLESVLFNITDFELTEVTVIISYFEDVDVVVVSVQVLVSEELLEVVLVEVKVEELVVSVVLQKKIFD
jgi:hypothetical protein